MSQEIVKTGVVGRESFVDQTDDFRKETANLLMQNFNRKAFVDLVGAYCKLQFGKEIETIYTTGSFSMDELKAIRAFADTALNLPEGYSITYNGPDKK